MRIDDIRSPGFLTNSHALRKEVVRAISFCQVQGEESRAEKLTDLILFFREALEICDNELPKTEPAFVASYYQPVLSSVTKEEPVNAPKKSAAKGKATR